MEPCPKEAWEFRAWSLPGAGSSPLPQFRAGWSPSVIRLAARYRGGCSPFQSLSHPSPGSCCSSQAPPLWTRASCCCVRPMPQRSDGMEALGKPWGQERKCGGRAVASRRGSESRGTGRRRSESAWPWAWDQPGTLPRARTRKGACGLCECQPFPGSEETPKPPGEAEATGPIVENLVQNRGRAGPGLCLGAQPEGQISFTTQRLRYHSVLSSPLRWARDPERPGLLSPPLPLQEPLVCRSTCQCVHQSWPPRQLRMAHPDRPPEPPQARKGGPSCVLQGSRGLATLRPPACQGFSSGCDLSCWLSLPRGPARIVSITSAHQGPARIVSIPSAHQGPCPLA